MNRAQQPAQKKRSAKAKPAEAKITDLSFIDVKFVPPISSDYGDKMAEFGIPPMRVKVNNTSLILYPLPAKHRIVLSQMYGLFLQASVEGTLAAPFSPEGAVNHVDNVALRWGAVLAHVCNKFKAFDVEPNIEAVDFWEHLPAEAIATISDLLTRGEASPKWKAAPLNDEAA